MNDLNNPLSSNRRQFIDQSVNGFGYAALAGLLGSSAQAGDKHYKGIIRPTHKAPRAKCVIHLCMAGGPSHLETFDYKPAMKKNDGKDMPESFTKGKPIAQLQGRQKLKILGPQHEFKQYGQGGNWMSNIFPHLSTVSDDLCVLKSVVTSQINHDPAHTVFNTGTSLPSRPSMGSWVNYALGSDAEDLPGYVVLTSEGGGQAQPIASRQWSSGFLPSRFQGVSFNSVGDPVHYVKSPAGVSQSQQDKLYAAINKINTHSNQQFKDPEIETRIAQYELAAKMQMSVPELTDTTQEPQNILDLYGAKPGDGSFASNCLLARRLVERGVRFIQLYHRGWDHHGGVKKGTELAANYVDQGCAALIKDLKQRGLLDDVLIIWGGEFGRTPMAQGSGRDHHIQGYSMWMAGAGLKGGQSYGETDELGYAAVENPVHVGDIHNTMLDLLGIDHLRLSYKFQGLDSRLTGVDQTRSLVDVLS